MKRLLFLTVLCTGIAMFLAGPVCARVTGQCANCHSMHNSQNGVDLLSEPLGQLLKADCVGCHSSATAEQSYTLGSTTVPVVNYTARGPSTYLAGGNFYWVGVGADDTKGHNVLGIAAEDGLISNTTGAPGDLFNCANSCHTSLAVDHAQTYSMGLRGNGCQGCHLDVKHHANDGTGTKYVDTAEKGWYRFLSGHQGAISAGVKGIEDSDWQETVSATDHNEYLGVEIDKTELGGGTSLTNFNMSSFCCGCHGNFHVQNTVEAIGGGSQSPWIRHPSDFIIPSVGEYSNITAYDPLSPVARPTGFGGWATGTPSDGAADGTDMVMCLSCHRPHGTPYADLLRWDYDATLAGSGTSDTGCFYCHTTKNES